MKPSDTKPLQPGAMNLFHAEGDSEWTVIVGFEQDEGICGGTSVAHVSAGTAIQAAKVALAEKSAVIERGGLETVQELTGESVDPLTMEYWVKAVIPGRVHPAYPYDSADPDGDFRHSHDIECEGVYRPDGQVSEWEEDPADDFAEYSD